VFSVEEAFDFDYKCGQKIDCKCGTLFQISSGLKQNIKKKKIFFLAFFSASSLTFPSQFVLWNIVFKLLQNLPSLQTKMKQKNSN